MGQIVHVCKAPSAILASISIRCCLFPSLSQPNHGFHQKVNSIILFMKMISLKLSLPWLVMCRLNIISHVLGIYSSYLVKLGLIAFDYFFLFNGKGWATLAFISQNHPLRGSWTVMGFEALAVREQWKMLPATDLLDPCWHPCLLLHILCCVEKMTKDRCLLLAWELFNHSF